MPKMKTHSSAKKRFKVTAGGTLRRLKAKRKSGAAFASAPTTGSRRKHRRHAGEVDVSPGDARKLRKLLGLRNR